MIKLITGNSGDKHITSADDGALYAALAGSGLVVFGTGSRFNGTMLSSSVFQISDGEGMIDGRHFRIEPGNKVDINLSEGVAGYNRNDLVLLHYKNKGGLETLTLEVLSGDYSTGTASDPSYNASEIGILEGSSDVYVPMFRLRRTGTSMPVVEPFFTVKGSGSGAMMKTTFSASVPVSGWTEQTDHSYTQTVSVAGITDDDTGLVDIDMSEATVETATDLQESWALVGRVETVNGGIKLTAYSGVPSVNLKVKIEVTR